VQPGSERAVTLVDWTPDGYGSAAARDQIAAIAATGATRIVVVVTAYQGDAGTGLPAAYPGLTPTPAAVAAALQNARAAGLQVGIKPHVDLRDGRWRGTIAPADPAAWFEAYRTFLLPWADFAAANGADLFVVGTELAGTIAHADAWRQLVGAVRARFPGTLTYAASWDEAERIGFWSALDVVGVDAYYPIAGRNDPGRFELLRGWQPWLERLEILHHKVGRRVLFTEIGYRSVDGAGMQPARFDAAARADPGEQADLYWAALQATGDAAWITGLVWWNWPARGGGGPADTDYTPAGKPAQSELQRAWIRP
jgi:glycosyl hydrolase family 113